MIANSTVSFAAELVAQLRQLPRKERIKAKRKYRRQAVRRDFYRRREAEVSEQESDDYDVELEKAVHEMQQRQFDAREAEAQKAFEAAQQLAAKADAERERKAQERLDAAKREEERRVKAAAAPVAVRQGVPLAQMTHEELVALEEEYGRSLEAERDNYNCPFYLKTGSCRYGPQCGKKHPYPPVSPTVMIRNMYDGPGMAEQLEEDAGDDLLHEETEIYNAFSEFYTDALPGFERFGKLVQFRVARNNAIHLRGNVYAQYERIEDAVTAYQGLSGRFYGGKKLQPEFVPVTKWKSAVCGLADRNKCPRGKLCNFLHVFRNPKGAFPLRDDSGGAAVAGPEAMEERRDRYASGSDRRRDDDRRYEPRSDDYKRRVDRGRDDQRRDDRRDHRGRDERRDSDYYRRGDDRRRDYERPKGDERRGESRDERSSSASSKEPEKK